MSSRKVTHKKQMLAALEKSLGVVTSAAKTVGIDRRNHYKWMIADPKYKEAVEDIENIALDYAESRLHKSIGEGSDTAVIFFLKTKGKKRGYIEKQEIEHSGEMGITWNEVKNYESKD